MEWSIKSDQGRVREKNQDSIASYIREDGLGFLCVCDGIGGARAGEVASSMACSLLKEKVVQSPKMASMVELRHAMTQWLEDINRTIFQQSRKNINYRGMGTTLVAVLFFQNAYLAVNIGDSRIYSLTHDDELERISFDHSLVFDMVRNGELTEEQANHHPQRNYLTNALGIETEVKIDFYDISADSWKMLLLCSDGLHGYVSDKSIRRTLLNGKMSLSEKTDVLIELANDAGGFDNISVALLKRKDKQ